MKGDLSSCEEYSIEGKKWRKIPSLTENKFSPSVCSFRSRYLYSFGGLTDSGTHGSKLIESLDTEDIEAKLWTKIVFSPGKEVWNEALFVGCAQINPEAILLFGGSIGKKMLNDSFIFNPTLKTFTVGPKLGIAEDFLRAKPTITDKEVIIVGRTMLDLHTYSLITHKWQSMFKSSWNPEAPPPVKSDTI